MGLISFSLIRFFLLTVLKPLKNAKKTRCLVLKIFLEYIIKETLRRVHLCYKTRDVAYAIKRIENGSKNAFRFKRKTRF